MNAKDSYPDTAEKRRAGMAAFSGGRVNLTTSDNLTFKMADEVTMTTKHTPATPLPIIAVDLNGYISAKDWRYQPLTQALSLDEKREVERRCNAYPELVAALAEFTKRAELLARSLRIDARTYDGITKDQAADRLDHDAERNRALLAKLGEAA